MTLLARDDMVDTDDMLQRSYLYGAFSQLVMCERGGDSWLRERGCANLVEWTLLRNVLKSRQFQLRFNPRNFCSLDASQEST